jgi:hypothetical protein
MDPVASGQRTEVTVIGDGFPAPSTATTAESFLVAVTYAGTQRGNPIPDASGHFEFVFLVPTTATIPSDNTVTALITGPTSAGGPTASISVIHRVPEASLQIEPGTGISGSSAMVTGVNFAAFTGVTSLQIGPSNVNVLPAPNPNTDKFGNFTATILIPGLDIGIQTVVAQVGGTTAVATFEVLSTPTTPSVTSGPTAEVFAEIAVGTLVRVWNFDNATKAWAFFDPDFADVSSYSTASSGDIVWVNVTVGTDFQSGSLTLGWNLIVLK